MKQRSATKTDLFAEPSLAGLDGQTKFLHDLSISGATTTDALNMLLGPTRCSGAQHPFYILNASDRASVVEHLKSRETN